MLCYKIINITLNHSIKTLFKQINQLTFQENTHSNKISELISINAFLKQITKDYF